MRGRWRWALLALAAAAAILAAAAAVRSMVEGPFEPATARLEDGVFRGNAVDLPEEDPRVRGKAKGFEPEQISLSLSVNHDSVWVTWITENTEPSRSPLDSMDPDDVAKAFVEHYYRTFDSNRAGLGGLYQDASMLAFEGAKIQGAQAIVGKLMSLPFQQCVHIVSTIDCQPSGPAGGMLVFVSGSLQLSGEQHQLKFSQMFHLMPTPQGSYYVLNDIFRLIYG